MNVGDLFEVAIEMMDDDQTQEIEAGAAKVRTFFEHTNQRLSRALDQMEWDE